MKNLETPGKTGRVGRYVLMTEIVTVCWFHQNFLFLSSLSTLTLDILLSTLNLFESLCINRHIYADLSLDVFFQTEQTM